MAFAAGEARGGEVSNLINDRIEDHFEVRSFQADDQGAVLIAGYQEAVTEADARLLRKLSTKVPARSKEYSRVLAEVNRRAAVRSRDRVSPSSETTYLPAVGEPFEGIIHDEEGQEIPTAGMVLFGIDMTDLMRGMAGAVLPRSSDDAKMEVLQQDAIDESVKIEDC